MSPIPEDHEDPEKARDQDINHFDGPDFFPGSNSDESDEEDEVDYSGYEPLPQEPDGPENDVEEIVSTPPSGSSTALDGVIRHILDADTNNAIGTVSSSIFQDADAKDCRDKLCSDLWNKPREKDDALPIDTAKSEEIKAVMSKIKLPAPDWAKTIPEDDWKASVLSKVHTNEPQTSSK